MATMSILIKRSGLIAYLTACKLDLGRCSVLMRTVLLFVSKDMIVRKRAREWTLTLSANVGHGRVQRAFEVTYGFEE